FLPFDKEAGFNVVNRMREIAQSHRASVAQIAIAWLLAKHVVASVIVGASKLHQLEDNLKAADVKLSEAEVAELDALTAPAPLYPNWFNANLMDAQHKAAFGG
ncbi:MAG: aldo/keto reductase, partial [Blastocatellia bacterium]|nr:aldo/keto reductase [Blastocatellia bacterium]